MLMNVVMEDTSVARLQCATISRDHMIVSVNLDTTEMEIIVVELIINLFHSVFALLYSPDNFAENLLERKANDSCQKIIWYGGWYTLRTPYSIRKHLLHISTVERQKWLQPSRVHDWV